MNKYLDILWKTKKNTVIDTNKVCVFDVNSYLKMYSTHAYESSK